MTALTALDASAFVPGAVVLVVGVHFLALARVLDTPLYDRTGGWLCLVALIALGVATLDGPASQASAGVGVAVVLWATAWLLGGDPSGDIEPRNVETPSERGGSGRARPDSG